MPKNRLVNCLYRCPSGLVDFNVWPRRKETDAEACIRKLKAIGKNGACTKLLVRSIDGINKEASRLSKATTRFTLPIRRK
jgi:hypothetical protein